MSKFVKKTNTTELERDLVLDKAKEAINGDRQEDYGDAKENFSNIANMWSIYLKQDVKPYQVADMMTLLKLCRNMNRPKEDTYIDIAGYAALGHEVSQL